MQKNLHPSLEDRRLSDTGHGLMEQRPTETRAELKKCFAK